MTSRTKKDLIEALRILRKRGWTQGELEDRNGRLCALGAIEGGCTGWWCTRWWDPARSTVEAEAALRSAIGVTHIADWNDAPGRTQAEVEAAFARAIAGCE